MVIRHGFRFKIKATPEIEGVLVVMAGHARFVWNKALRLNLERLAQGLPIVRYSDLCGLLRLWKQSEEYGFLTEANAQALQQKLKDLDRAFADAFDPTQPGKRLPRFKKRGGDDSFRFPKNAKVENRRVYLPKIGWVGFFKSREIIGQIKQTTVTREANGWYVSIQTEYEIADPKPAVRGMIGVDCGVAVFAATSDGELSITGMPTRRAGSGLLDCSASSPGRRRGQTTDVRRELGSPACISASAASARTS